MNVSGACLARADLKTKLITGAGDPRRPTYAVGW
jgi:hypothetical protein